MISEETRGKLRQTVVSVRQAAEKRLSRAPRETVLFSCRAELRKYIEDGLREAAEFEDDDTRLEPAELDELRRFMNTTIARMFQEEFGAPF